MSRPRQPDEDSVGVRRPASAGQEARGADDPDGIGEHAIESAWMWPGRAIAMLRGWCRVEQYMADSSQKSPHVAWAVGSAGLVSAGLFLLMKRAKLFQWTKRNKPEPPSMSTYDSVTGLPTKRLFMILANQAVSRARKTGRQVAILMVELDHFALTEDLREVVHTNLVYRVQAARLKSALRTTDSVARLGERSFAALLENIVDGAAVAAVAAKMQQTVSLPFILEGREVFLTSRIGIGLSSPEARDAAVLLDLAAQAVSRARMEGYVMSGLPSDAALSALDPLTGVPFQ